MPNDDTGAAPVAETDIACESVTPSRMISRALGQLHHAIGLLAGNGADPSLLQDACGHLKSATLCLNAFCAPPPSGVAFRWGSAA